MALGYSKLVALGYSKLKRDGSCASTNICVGLLGLATIGTVQENFWSGDHQGKGSLALNAGDIPPVYMLVPRGLNLLGIITVALY